MTSTTSGYVRLFPKGYPYPIWSYETGATVKALAITPDGNYMVAGSNDNRLYMFDRNGLMWSYHTGDSFVSVAISSNLLNIIPSGFLISKSNDNLIWCGKSIKA